MSEEVVKTVREAVCLWRSAGVFQYKSQLNVTVPETAIIERMRSDPSAYEVELLRALRDENQLVVAYALAALKELGSSIIEDSPQFLREDKRRFMKRMGSFAPYTTVAKLLEELQQKPGTNPRAWSGLDFQRQMDLCDFSCAHLRGLLSAGALPLWQVVLKSKSVRSRSNTKARSSSLKTSC
jgi:hypothetical protein